MNGRPPPQKTMFLNEMFLLKFSLFAVSANKYVWLQVIVCDCLSSSLLSFSWDSSGWCSGGWYIIQAKMPESSLRLFSKEQALSFRGCFSPEEQAVVGCRCRHCMVVIERSGTKLCPWLTDCVNRVIQGMAWFSSFCHLSPPETRWSATDENRDKDGWWRDSLNTAASEGNW